MNEPRIKEIVRQFPENGIKLLLENPHNLEDLLRLGGLSLVDQIDFERVQPVGTTFVQQDFRHVESDLLLRAPLKQRRRKIRAILVYILIEHQTRPDSHMLLRVLEYVVESYRSQHRDWFREHGSSAGLKLQPVVPVVLYTGKRRWDSLGTIADLIELGPDIGDMAPSIQPLFINLPQIAVETLETKGALFGWILRLIQGSRDRPADFHRLVNRVVRHLERLARDDNPRWLELLSYLHAVVYYERELSEHEGIHQTIASAVSDVREQEETRIMGKTIAEALKEEGWVRGRREGREEGREEGLHVGEIKGRRATLLRLLRGKFKKVPQPTIRKIESTADLELLDIWLDRVLTAESLSAVGIK